MPTVSRRGAEYVSNAVKSWRLATNGSATVRRLLVFDMDFPPQSAGPPHWYARVFAPARPSLRTAFRSPRSHPPSWLELHRRDDAPRAPRKQTLGDSAARVAWRSKEAGDYAEVLRRCAGAAAGRYVAVVQDDVLFTRGVADIVQWADAAIARPPAPPAPSGQHARRAPKRVCSLSLFDLAPDGAEDGHEQKSSNMVARVWQTERAARVAGYIAFNFDEAPVDWLTDRLCKSGRRVTLVKEPNVVRHRGAVSSFPENKRGATLT